MGIKDIIIYLLRTQRQKGRTTALAIAARIIDGVFVVMSDDDKHRIKKKFPSLNVVNLSENYLKGCSKPIILDHVVIESLLSCDEK